MVKTGTFKDSNNNENYLLEIPYSTTEHRIGTWTDGKPLYRKVITKKYDSTVGDNSAMTVLTLAHNIDNIDTPVSCSGRLINSTGLTYILPTINIYNGVVGKSTAVHSFSKTEIVTRIICDTWGTNNTFTYICEYTKTTD